jgi:hypothetical protein
MEATEVAKGYFDAWSQRDPETIIATFVEGAEHPPYW